MVSKEKEVAKPRSNSCQRSPVGRTCLGTTEHALKLGTELLVLVPDPGHALLRGLRVIDRPHAPHHDPRESRSLAPPGSGGGLIAGGVGHMSSLAAAIYCSGALLPLLRRTPAGHQLHEPRPALKIKRLLPPG